VEYCSLSRSLELTSTKSRKNSSISLASSNRACLLYIASQRSSNLKRNPNDHGQSSELRDDVSDYHRSLGQVLVDLGFARAIRTIFPATMPGLRVIKVELIVDVALLFDDPKSNPHEKHVGEEDDRVNVGSLAEEMLSLMTTTASAESSGNDPNYQSTGRQIRNLCNISSAYTASGRAFRPSQHKQTTSLAS
jgi:hypothetical protein